MNHHFSHPPARARFAALLCLTAVLAFAAPASAQSIERDMFVSVLDRSDTPVLTLGARDFIVREDGRAREVLRARRASDVISLTILVDTSQALSDRVADVRKGVEGLIARMREHARVSIVAFGDRPTIYADNTSDPEALARGVGRIFPIAGAGAYVLDALDDVLKGLEKQKPERAAVVVVWAGGQEFGNETDSALLARLVPTGASLHVITIGAGIPNDIQTPEGRFRESVFDRGTADSGGRRQSVLTSMALPDVLDRLASELLGQYRITFARPDSLIPPERTEVAVRPAGLTARGTLVPVRSAGKR